MKIPKSYRYYKLEDLKNVLQITAQQVENLLEEFEYIEASQLLQDILKHNLQIPMLNEKAKSELIVMPILVEMWRKNQNFKPLSGITFPVEPDKGLTGRCDFLVSSNATASELTEPVVCIFEAKDDNIERWYGQCGSEMLAARIFNKKKGTPIEIIHGAVTNGFTWQFLKLENQTLFIDSQRYAIANLPQLLGAIQKIYDIYKPKK